jgi:hypothetical protein
MARTCKKIQNQLVAYLDREVTGGKSRAIAEHLQSCPLCQQELLDLQESLGQLLAWPDIKPAEDYDQRFWQKIRQYENQPAHNRSLGYLLGTLVTRNLNIAASVAFALLLVLTTFFLSRPSSDVTKQDSYLLMNMDLFRNLEVIEKTDALENFEIISVLDQLEQDTAQ